MPIYEYRCGTCGFQKEYLQKLNDAPLTTCPECGKESFGKILTAAGFQLKGSGWYATDFKGNGTKPKGSKGESKDATSESKPDGAKAAESAPAPAPATESAKAPSPVPAGGPGPASS